MFRLGYEKNIKCSIGEVNNYRLIYKYSILGFLIERLLKGGFGGELERPESLAAVFLVIAIIVGIVLVPELNNYANVVSPSSTENAFMYEKSMDVLVMLLIGFGFLMVFVKKYGFSSVTATCGN